MYNDNNNNTNRGLKQMTNKRNRNDRYRPTKNIIKYSKLDNV